LETITNQDSYSVVSSVKNTFRYVSFERVPSKGECLEGFHAHLSEPHSSSELIADLKSASLIGKYKLHAIPIFSDKKCYHD
jgi:hypothetical protein